MTKWEDAKEARKARRANDPKVQARARHHAIAKGKEAREQMSKAAIEAAKKFHLDKYADKAES